MEAILIWIALLAPFVPLSVASYIHRSRQRAFLTKILKVDEPLRKRVAREFGVDGAAVTGVSVFDVLYNTMKLDTDALQGMKHLHHKQNFESLGDLMDFIKGEIIKAEPGDGVWRQMVHKYKGYTGEEAVVDFFREKGHDVEIPKSGTNEEWDLKIDGEPFNTKVTDNPQYIQKHLDEHSSGVIANREMADAFHDNPRVLINPTSSSQPAFHRTGDTFEGIADLGEGLDSIPIITLAINTGKNIHKMHKGNLDLKTAVEHTFLDTTAVGAGGWLGSKVGLGLGLVMAPATGGLSAVIIPAATTLIGSLVGIITGKGVSGWFKGRHLRSALEELQHRAIEFRDSFIDLYQTVVDAMDLFIESRLTSCGGGKREEGFVKRIVFPKCKTTFFCMASRELKAERATSRRFYADLRNTVLNTEEPSEGGMILFANCQQQGIAMLYEVDPLPDRYAAIEAQLEIIETEQRKLR